MIQKLSAYLFKTACKLPNTQLMRKFQNTHCTENFEETLKTSQNVKKVLTDNSDVASFRYKFHIHISL